MQAHRGGLLPAGRGIRPRPVPDLRLARPEPRGADGAVGDEERREGRRRGQLPAAAPVRPAEPLGAEMETFWNGTSATSRRDRRRSWRFPRSRRRWFGGWAGFRSGGAKSPLLETLAATYAAASPRGMDVYVWTGEQLGRCYAGTRGERKRIKTANRGNEAKSSPAGSRARRSQAYLLSGGTSKSMSESKSMSKSKSMSMSKSMSKSKSTISGEALSRSPPPYEGGVRGGRPLQSPPPHRAPSKTKPNPPQARPQALHPYGDARLSGALCGQRILRNRLGALRMA